MKVQNESPSVTRLQEYRRGIIRAYAYMLHICIYVYALPMQKTYRYTICLFLNSETKLINSINLPFTHEFHVPDSHRYVWIDVYMYPHMYIHMCHMCFYIYSVYKFSYTYIYTRI
jgi:hypothetical protein